MLRSCFDLFFERVGSKSYAVIPYPQDMRLTAFASSYKLLS